MKSVYLPLVFSEDFLPLPRYKQLAVPLAKAGGKENRFTKIDVIGWPFLAYKLEKSGGYLIFDETLKLSTEIKTYIIQDYERISSILDNSKDENEILNYITSIKWGDTKGSSILSFRGIIEQNMQDIFKLGNSDIPARIIDKSLKEIDIELSISDIEKTMEKIKDDINNIERAEEKIKTTIEIIKGRKAEDKKRVEEEFNKKILEKSQILKENVGKVKKTIEEEVGNTSKQLYSKLSDIEVLIAKAEIDMEAGYVENVNSVYTVKNKYLSEINQKISEIKEKYKKEIHRIVEDINSLKIEKQTEINRINNKIQELDNIQNQAIMQLEQIKKEQLTSLDRLAKLPKFLSFMEDRVEVVVPFMVLEGNNRILISPQIYKGGKKAF